MFARLTKHSRLPVEQPPANPPQHQHRSRAGHGKRNTAATEANRCYLTDNQRQANGEAQARTVQESAFGAGEVEDGGGYIKSLGAFEAPKILVFASTS